MNYKESRAELHRRRYLERLASPSAPPEKIPNLWKILLPVFLFLVLTFAVIPRGLAYLQRTTTSQDPQGHSKDAQGQSKDPQDPSKDMQVTQLIQDIEDQLVASEHQRLAKNRAALFHVKSFDLEVNFVIKRENSVKGTTNYNIVAIDNQIGSSNEITHKLTLHMETPPKEPGKAAASKKRPTGAPITTLGGVPPTTVKMAGPSQPRRIHEKPQ